MKKAQGFQAAGPGRGKTLDQNDPVFSTADILAKQHGVSMDEGLIEWDCWPYRRNAYPRAREADLRLNDGVQKTAIIPRARRADQLNPLYVERI